jgi:hypothetical protein
MKGIKWIISSIALSSLVAACGTMSVGQHRSEAQRYEKAAQAARNRGDSTEAARDEALARTHEAEARSHEELEASDLGGAP